ncbi:MAG: ABC transporter permease [Chitinophagales bacterium]
MDNKPEWEWEIKPDENWFKLNLREIVQYKDLLFRFVRRDIIASYQQTILGPIWVFLQPLLTTVVYFIIFRKIANIPTADAPPILFYLPGIIIWTYFSDCFTGVMNTFLYNAYIFSKVYFPRVIVPISNVFFHSFRLGIQLVLFLIVYAFFAFRMPQIRPSAYILLLPYLLILTAGFALGAGLIISVLTAKYRDLDNILQFLLRLFMFATPVVYPVSLVPEQYRYFFWLNPLTAVIETFRAAFFSTTTIRFNYLLLSTLTVSLILLTGLIVFRKHEIKIMDVI